MSDDPQDAATQQESLLPKSPTGPVDTAVDETTDEKKGLASPEVKAEVKFIAADSQNGDAILDIENVRAAFSGMGKEELMKFANDPFWVRTRWILFVSFWLLWVAMVAGAIAIIVLAPKCAPPKPRRWWEQSALYSVDSLSSSSKDLGKVEGVERYLTLLSKGGADGVILPPIMNTDASNNPEAVVDFKSIRSDLGNLDEFKKAVANLKNTGAHVILEIAPGHTSKEHDWFKQSVEKADRYKDYYIWVDSPQTNSLTPSNWGNDWKQATFARDEHRGAFYLRQSSTDLPVLNLTNPDVIKEYEEIFKFWLDNGVSGFQVRGVSSFFANSHINPPINNNNNQSDAVSAIRRLHALVTNQTQDNVLILRGDLPIQANKSADDFADILSSPLSLFTLPEGFTAQQLKTKIEAPVNESAIKWPVWEVPDAEKPTTLPPGIVDGLIITSMLLPGTPVFHDNSLLDLSRVNSATDTVVSGADQQIKSAAQHRAEIFKELSNSRKNMVAVNFGKTNITLVNGTDNVSVFTFTRIKSGNPGILVVVNPSGQNTTVDLTGLNKVPEELSVNSVSYRADVDSPMLQPKNKPLASSINLPGMSAVVFTFVPKKES